MAKESTQQKLSRVRAPRVHITYDVEVGDAIEIKELPFVMGVFGNFTGQPEQPLPRMMDRKFVEVTPDNFDQVLDKMSPHVAFRVDNKLSDDGSQLNVNLNFKELADFDPEQVASKIEPVKKLLDLRTKLSNLRASLQGNDKLDEMLQDVVSNTEKRQQLSSELGLDQDKGGNNG